MGKPKIPSGTRDLVEARANGKCEYCKAMVQFSPHPFTIDHIIPPSKEGTESPENLAYACFGCNRCKHDKTTAVDPFTQQEAKLFDPRNQNWNDHFIWDAISFTKILGLTPTGRATVHALQLNRPALIRMRKELIEVNRHPPKD
ncbi:MAG: HNH endonuclease [Saprospiraceae bacterium]|nr:HNH endonuclease [Saprospiraceae bacterium]MCF8250664.1 HNH endonuclease [Saprospiraceae bacterium]MCF8280802.1 HNH endonuclease [Bacteroidales bacterium]MCF8312516.1 HNH endonuclease [Saprospiraceae bacterium]MCF8440804.1 HNH endonuclease [Saprospiraceae bacterium]